MSRALNERLVIADALCMTRQQVHTVFWIVFGLVAGFLVYRACTWLIPATHRGIAIERACIPEIFALFTAYLIARVPTVATPAICCVSFVQIFSYATSERLLPADEVLRILCHPLMS